MLLRCCVIVLLWLPLAQVSAEWDTSGFLQIEGRWFGDSPIYAGQESGPVFSGALQPELRWYSEDGDSRFTLVAFTRIDSRDEERTHSDVREAYYSFRGEDWDLVVGVNKVFWGVAESRHLVDVINQTDLVEDIDGEDKLGQPMINLNLQRDWGLIELYLLPGFRERNFPGTDGRLRAPLVVDAHPAYESSREDRHLDLAARYSHYFGDLDIGLHLFSGTSREPSFIPGTNGLTAYYEQMSQFGIDLQYTRGAWLWKLEGIYRSADSDDFAALVGGFEYTRFGVTRGGGDLGLLLEWQYDERERNAPVSAADDDWFAGFRFALNDVRDTSILAGVVVDPSTGGRFYNVEAETRLADQATVAFRLRSINSDDAGDVLSPFDQDDYLQLRLNWYF